jgi:flagellar secretion chaperone FliS
MAMLRPGCDTYKKVNIETASQGKLIVLLLNGAMHRAEEAKRQLSRGHIDGVHNNLIRAQEIIAELRSSLNMQAGGSVARNLDRLYEYYQHLLIKANVNKVTEPIDEFINLVEPIRDAWVELFELLAKQDAPQPISTNQFQVAALNLQG